MSSRVLPLAFLCFSSLLTVAAKAKADIVWETNYDRARAKSIATGKPLFVDVYTDWCGWCKKLDSTVYPDPRIQQLAQNFVMVRLNAEAEGAPFAQMMQVTGYPTLFFATTQGAQVARRGYIDPASFAATMQETLRRNGPIQPRGALATPTRQLKKAVTRATSPRRSWKAQPEIRRVVGTAGYGGTFILGDSGIKVLDSPSQKARKAQTAKQKDKSSRR